MNATYERPLTARIDLTRGPLDLKNYERAGGYRALRRALRELTPDEVTGIVKAANLRGRGGAGFPAGLKWASMQPVEDAGRPRYLVANADEMEPGAFKDRVLLEGDPHQLVEAVIITGYAISADVGYIFLRGEYRRAARLLERAIAEARGAGYLGPDILGSGWGMELYLHTSAGRYLCGESSALLNALEGGRAIPRAKPPRSPTAGAWGKPTIVNNVETLCNVPHIVERGADWFLGLSIAPEGRHGKDGGTKIYGASGRLRRPGWWELPMGTPLGEIVEQHAGGMREGYRLRALLPGGASTSFLTHQHLAVTMDFDSVQGVGSRLGTGTLTVLDDRTCPVGMVENLERFFARESCGWCTPCRDGLPWTERLLTEIESGRGRPEDLDTLTFHTRFLGMGKTFCAHAPGAMMPLESALKLFRDDFERHIRDGRCPYRDSTLGRGS